MVFGAHRAVLVALAHVQQVRRVGHRFHAADDDDIGVAREDGVAAHHRRLHARAAHLVDGGGLKALVFAGLDAGLASGGLALSGGKAVAHDDFVRFARLQLRFGHGGLDGQRAELVGGKACEVAQQAAHRGAGHTNDDDGIFIGHGGIPS